MIKEIEIYLSPKDASDEKFYREIVAENIGIDQEKISDIKVIRRSIDGRKVYVRINMKFQVTYDEPAPTFEPPHFEYQNVKNKPEILIAGAGPAGLFAALRLIELGYKPIILERGKDVSSRKIDIATISREQTVNTESNYCFGEGGAGAFSDGKLFTRSKKRGNQKKILEIFNFHGANENILIDAHPHIGTDKLPSIITAIRETIINAGGEIHFNTKLSDLIITDNKITGVITQNNDKIEAKALILATGHSARDVYELLHSKDILLEAKPFAMGVRIEHPQSLIDSIQYHCKTRSEYLPAASYNIATKLHDRGVYSFCMCPGGHIVSAATAPDQIVVNGMSTSKRDSYFANSGMVVEIKLDDLADYKEHGVLAGMKFQESLERMAFQNGGSGLVAPAQRMTDFLNNKLSADLPNTSYIPGVISSPLHFWLPDIISKSLKKGLKQISKNMKGYLSEQAVLVGVESRTSTPVRIPRDKETLQHPVIGGLYPCGEGAGFAGGILSSAIDGERCAEQAAVLVGN